MIKKILLWVYIVIGLVVSYKAITMHNERSEYYEVTVTSLNKQTIPMYRGFRYEYSYDYTVNSNGERGKEHINYYEYSHTNVGDTKMIFLQDVNTWTVEQIGYTVGGFVFLFSIMITGIYKISK